MIHAIYREDEVIVALNGVPYTIDEYDQRYDAVLSALEFNDEEELTNLLTMSKRFQVINDEMAKAGITDNCGTYYYNGSTIPISLSNYLLAAVERNSVQPVIKFIQQLFENPNHHTRQHLFEFMESKQMPIDANGHFLAFKVVRSDYHDKHTGTMNNAPGSTLEVNWSQVDTNPEVDCSYGLHACSYEYISSFYSAGDRVVSVAISPTDVGSVPYYYNGSKIRVRKYKVIADITESYIAEHTDMLNLDAGDGGLNPSQPDNRDRSYTRDRL